MKNRFLILKWGLVILCLILTLLFLFLAINYRYFDCNTDYLLREKSPAKKENCIRNIYNTDCKLLLHYYAKAYANRDVPLNDLDEEIIKCIDYKQFMIKEDTKDNRTIKFLNMMTE
jgi:hypothetical protein